MPRCREVSESLEQTFEILRSSLSDESKVEVLYSGLGKLLFKCNLDTVTSHEELQFLYSSPIYQEELSSRYSSKRVSNCWNYSYSYSTALAIIFAKLSNTGINHVFLLQHK